MVLSQLKRLFLEDYVLAIVFSDLPLSFHFLDFDIHLFLQPHLFLDLFNFLIQAVIEFCDVSLRTVHIVLVKCLEFKYLFL